MSANRAKVVGLSLFGLNLPLRRRSLVAGLAAISLVVLAGWSFADETAKKSEEPTTKVVRGTSPQIQKPSVEIKTPGPAVIDAAKYDSLQAAFDAVPESGGIVNIPPGYYRLNEPLVLSRGDTRIQGSGAATHLINYNEEGKPALFIRPTDLDKNPKARLWRVQLADFRISGNPKGGDPKSGDGVLAQSIDEIYIHGLSVDRNGQHGINLINCYEDPRISDSILTYNCQAGLNIVAGHDIVVNANHFEENFDALRCSDSFNLCMNGNNLDDHLRHGVVIENTYGSVVSGNMIEECNGTAILLDRDCYGITLSANVIAHNSGGGVDLRNALGCAVSANTFTLMANHALRIGPKSTRITVTGNNFCNDWLGDHVKRKESNATGITLEGTSYITISGNSFSGLNGYAIQANSVCKRLNITGNVMVDLHVKNQKKQPAIDLGGAKEVILSQNILQPVFAKPQKDAAPPKK